MGLSCGNPAALASLRPGEVVLDLGAGGGLDVFVAAELVGPLGRAIGVDMTADMVSRARQNARQFGQEPDWTPSNFAWAKLSIFLWRMPAWTW